MNFEKQCAVCSLLHFQRIFEFKDPHLFPVCILYLPWMLFDLSFGSTSLKLYGTSKVLHCIEKIEIYQH